MQTNTEVNKLKQRILEVGNMKGLVAYGKGKFTYQQAANYFSNRAVARDAVRKILLTSQNYLEFVKKEQAENEQILRSLTE